MLTIEDIIKKVQSYNPQADPQMLLEAYEFAAQAHAGQKRLSGEDYIQHSLATVDHLADMRLDLAALAAGLLHDVPEDTSYTLEDIKKKFGKEVAKLVEGITKLGTLKYRGLERYAENLRRMFIAMSDDIRVILIKFADRWHNLETLSFNRPDKRRRVALETLEIYAPIANRLGMGEMRGILEDLAFPYAYPKEYDWALSVSEDKLKIEKKYIEKIKKIVQKELLENKIEIISIHGRMKYLYSLYKKLLEKDKDINKIYDLIAVRIITKNVADCYRVLGIIHKKWVPLKGRIKDYIAQPKPNGYQSLHTTVFADKGKVVEFQIRDLEMHELAEYGVAAHWHYKELSNRSLTKEKTDWLKNLLEVQKKLADNQAYLKEVKVGFFQNHIFVFTPKGDVIDLPEGACPVDFAYTIHTDIGDKCVGAMINDQIAPLETKLKNGDVVEILINKNRTTPNEDWLNFVITNAAKEKIRQTLRKKETSRKSKLLKG
ncbi:MAG: RelA/SpoT family protein [Candidatus Komeilibacteria bacterium]|nr:RelA/SpoT family protein [Candidatus Komeilibacteria bacterium]